MADKIKMPNGNTYEIEQDDAPDDPRQWGTPSKFLFFHKRYNLGDKNPYKTDDYRSWNELEAVIVKDLKPVAMIDVGMVDHSGLTLYEGSGAHPCDPGGWDSGRIGFALITREAALKEFSTNRITKKIKDRCFEILRADLEVYNQYVSGDVWMFTVRDQDNEVLEAVGGWYGYKDCEEEAKRAAMTNSPKLDALLETAACVC